MTDGTFGNVAFNRCLLAWDNMMELTRDGEEPFETQEEAEAEQASGDFVGYMPDAISTIITKVKKSYADAHNELVIPSIIVSHASSKYHIAFRFDLYVGAFRPCYIQYLCGGPP